MISGVFLASLLVPLLVGSLRRWLDPSGRALAALRWPLRARGFVLACLAWTVAGATWVMVLDSAPAMLVGAVLLGLAWALIPFLGWNPVTLDSVVPSRWWRPGWPGWRAVAACLLLWLAYPASGIVVALVEDASTTAWPILTAWMLDALLSGLVVVAAIHLWLNRGGLRAASSEALRFLRSRGLAEYVWLSLLTTLLLSVLLFPMLVLALEAIFALPGYKSLARDQGTPWPWWLGLLSGIAGKASGLIFVASVPAGLHLTLATAWLLRRRGAGQPGPAGPPVAPRHR